MDMCARRPHPAAYHHPLEACCPREGLHRFTVASQLTEGGEPSMAPKLALMPG